MIKTMVFAQNRHYGFWSRQRKHSSDWVLNVMKCQQIYDDSFFTSCAVPFPVLPQNPDALIRGVDVATGECQLRSISWKHRLPSAYTARDENAKDGKGVHVCLLYNTYA